MSDVGFLIHHFSGYECILRQEIFVALFLFHTHFDTTQRNTAHLHVIRFTSLKRSRTTILCFVQKSIPIATYKIQSGTMTRYAPYKNFRGHIERQRCCLRLHATISFIWIALNSGLHIIA